MKKFTLNIVLCIASFCSLFAAPPTVPASNIQFSAAYIEGDRFTFTFNKGNGGFRIIVVKQGSAVSSLPVNGTEYTANAAFGNAGTVFAPGDGYVVYKGSTAAATVSQTVTNLQPGTTYHVAIFEYNGSAVNTEYLTVGLNGNVTTKSAPTGQATITGFSAIAGNKLTVNWNVGNGERRLLIGRKGSPVNVTLQDFVDYAQSTAFGNGTVLNGDNYALYKGSGSSTTITNLEPNTVYHFALFEYNGNNAPVYLASAATASQLTNAGPTQASGTILFNNIEGNRLNISFAPGNGKHQLIIARQGQAPGFVPVNGQTYTANTAFQSGQEVAPGEYVMNTVNTDRFFTNLQPATTYYFRVYDFDVDAAGNTYYLTSAYSQNSTPTASAPTLQASNVRFENITGSSMTIKHDAGNSAYRLVVMKQGSPVDATPQDLIRYNGNQAFGSGTQITPGNYVMIGGQNSTSLPVSNLTPGLTYHVAVFGFNGNNYPVYATPAATASITIPNEPTTIATNWQTNTIQGNAFRIQWTGGDGGRRIVIARKNAAVTATPVDGVNYTASPVFGNGYEIAAEQFVVYNDVNRVVDIQGLEPGTTYHFAVFEYNSAAGNPDYLVSSFLSATGTTLSAPATQTSNLSASNIQDNQATINFSAGNGESRLFIMRAGSAVNVTPQDLVSYNAHTAFGTHQIGTGNYIVQKTGNGTAFTVTSLQPNTQYYVSAFEFNGSTAPVYLSPATSFNFTTTGSGITAPTVNANEASFSVTDGNKLTFNWNNGNGAKRMVVARQGSAVTFNPTNGVDYTANASFGSGSDLGSGQYVVYNGNAASNVTVTNLLPSTIYHFTVFEYNGTGVNTSYLIGGALTHNGSTSATPATGSNNVTATASNLSIAINWNSGSGNGRMVVMKEGSAVSSLPVDLSKYPANNVFGNGSQIGAGEYVVYAGNSNTVTVTGLNGNTTYHYAVFEYNGVDAPLYNTANVVSNSTLVPVTLPLTWLYFTAKEQDDNIILKWGTADELNSSHFIIERSIGSGFAAIGTMQAAGNGSNDYTYIDNTRLTGTVSYRIKQVDIDNLYTYSNQVVVKTIDQQAVLKLYPNPATESVRISLPQGMLQAAIKIYSIDGKLAKTKTVVNGELILLNDLPKGIYHVVINNTEKRLVEKLVIQ